MVFPFFQKTNETHYPKLSDSEFRSVFGRIEITIIFFEIYWPLESWISSNIKDWSFQDLLDRKKKEWILKKNPLSYELHIKQSNLKSASDKLDTKNTDLSHCYSGLLVFEVGKMQFLDYYGHQALERDICQIFQSHKTGQWH